MDTITITHTGSEGTTVMGDTRPYKDTIKGYRLRWSPTIGGWYVPNSRDRLPNVVALEMLAKALRDAGAEVEMDIDATPVSTADREARKAERLEDRQAALAAKAERKGSEADAHFGTVDQIASAIPFGQPILVGHHSERKSRRDAERIWKGMERSVEAQKESEAAARKADASIRHQRARETGPATMRRLERLRTEQRDVTRKMEQAERQSKQEWYDRLHAINLDLTDQITYWTDHLEALKADGWKQWGPDDFTPGDLLRYWGGTRKVVRVNKKSVSVESGYSWTDKVPYNAIRGKIAAEDIPTTDAAD